MGPMGELGALFNPGMRHEQEEQRAKQMLREEEGTGRKGRLNIDLSSGTVVIGADSLGGAADPDKDSGAVSDADAGAGSEAASGAGQGNDSGAGDADTAASDGAAQTNGADRSTKKSQAAIPAEPRVAGKKKGSATPSGKRHRNDAAAAPVGKSRRGR